MAAGKKCVSRRDFLAGAAMAAAALAGCSAGSGAKAEPAAKWGFERDDDLPLLCMYASGGSVVSTTADGWAPTGDFVQLHLGGGSIPGPPVKSAKCVSRRDFLAGAAMAAAPSPGRRSRA